MKEPWFFVLTWLKKHAFLTTDSSILPARLIGLSLGFITYRGAAVSDESARRSEELAGKSHKSAGSFRCVLCALPATCLWHGVGRLRKKA